MESSRQVFTRQEKVFRYRIESEFVMTVLKLYKTHPEVKLPNHQTKGSACFDLSFQNAGKGKIHGYSSKNKPVERILQANITIAPGDRMLIPTGIIMDIPEGYSVRLHARSGTSLKQGLVLANAEGVIDSDYVEEVFIILWNISENSVTITTGDRVAQAELVKNEEYTIEQTASRPIHKSTRTGGFGSTGVTTAADMIVINVPDKPVVPDFVKQKTEVIKRGRGRPKGSVKKA